MYFLINYSTQIVQCQVIKYKYKKMIEIGDRLKILRKEANLTQKELAEKLSITRVCYTRYENNVFSPDLDTLVALAKFYGVTTDYILGLEE